MKNNVFSVISGSRSIRFRMLWAFVAGLIAGFGASVAVPIGFFFEIPLSFIVFLGTFAATFYLLTRSTIRYMRKLSDGLTILSGGNLRFRFPAERKDELGAVAEHVNAMAEKLEQLIEKERRQEQSKMELITGVSHDLRTPLTSILGYLELLKDKAYKDETEVERFIANTHSKSIQLKTLIDELFEYTRLSRSESMPERSMIDLRELIGQMLAETEPLAKDERLVIESRMPAAPVPILVDAEKIRRAVDNLIANALKFSLKPGTVIVSLETGEKAATITVENRGEPIPYDRADRLFERFYKADESRSNPDRHSGAGLGLAIVRGIAELHGGRADLVYADGRFSFSISLPLIPEAAREANR